MRNLVFSLPCVQLGLDAEDAQYLLEAYSIWREDEPHLPYLSQPLALHPPTLDRDRSAAGVGSTPRKRGRPPAEGGDHKTGCARSEGFYKTAKAKAVRARTSSQARLIDQVRFRSLRRVLIHCFSQWKPSLLPGSLLLRCPPTFLPSISGIYLFAYIQ